MLYSPHAFFVLVYPEDFHDYLRQRSDINGTSSDTQHREMKCDHTEVGNCSPGRSKYTPHVLDAVYAVAMGMHNMLRCQPGKSCRDKLGILHQRYSKKCLFFSFLVKQASSKFASNANAGSWSREHPWGSQYPDERPLLERSNLIVSFR